MPVCPIEDIVLIEATTESLDGFGTLISEPDACDIEIVQWPRARMATCGARTGDEGGTTEGMFACAWEDHTLRAVNDAVSGDYILGWSCEPSAAECTKGDLSARDRVYIGHANYHPDGGQLFFPLDNGPFVAPLALPGDDVTPDDFVAFWFDGADGLYIHPGIWHEGVFPLKQRQRFFDKQGKVHARINVDLVKEFNCYVSFPMTLPLST